MSYRLYYCLPPGVYTFPIRVCKYAIRCAGFGDGCWDTSWRHVDAHMHEAISKFIVYLRGLHRQHGFFKSFLDQQKYSNSRSNGCAKLKKRTHILPVFFMAGFLVKGLLCESSNYNKKPAARFNPKLQCSAHEGMMPGCRWIGHVNVEV